MEKRDSGSKGEDADVSTAMVAISNAPVLKMLCSQASGPILRSMESYRCRSAQGKKFHVDLLGKGFSSMKRRCSRLCGSDEEEEEGESTATLALGLSTGGCGAGLWSNRGGRLGAFGAPTRVVAPLLIGAGAAVVELEDFGGVA
ncbi:hypothetical protein BHE74_00039585 [Ensete ventricosum]|nr:hypothetical protein BHE74_00039585 [Ensete ventricosum]RZS03643.1 hypothetical protein BHM03_00033838 [Ensete ventricosum]